MPAHNALEADRDYGTRFMANKRTQKPLKVRESLARYVLRREPRATLVDAERCQHSLRGSGELAGAVCVGKLCRRGTDGLRTPGTGGHEANPIATSI